MTISTEFTCSNMLMYYTQAVQSVISHFDHFNLISVFHTLLHLKVQSEFISRTAFGLFGIYALRDLASQATLQITHLSSQKAIEKFSLTFKLQHSLI